MFLSTYVLMAIVSKGATGTIFLPLLVCREPTTLRTPGGRSTTEPPGPVFQNLGAYAKGTS